MITMNNGGVPGLNTPIELRPQVLGQNARTSHDDFNFGIKRKFNPIDTTATLASKIDLSTLKSGNYRIECPHCGRGAKDKTAGLKVETNRAVVHCFRCNYTESFHQKSSNFYQPPNAQAQTSQTKHKSLSEWGRDIWKCTQELSGVAIEYLNARHCCIPPLHSDLRWHPALKHATGYVGAALVALITDVHSNEPLSLHRTWITSTGKADLKVQRMNLQNHSIDNGVIRLWPNDEVNSILGIAEGIETALSLAWFGHVNGCRHRRKYGGKGIRQESASARHGVLEGARRASANTPWRAAPVIWVS